MPSSPNRWLSPPVRAAALLLLVLATPVSAAPPAPAALPDSVLATVGDRRVTRSEFVRQWHRLGPQRRRDGDDPLRAKRLFLDELIHKEALTMAAEQAGAGLSPEDAGRLAQLRQGLLRQAYFRRMVLDSLETAAAGAGSREQRVRALEGRLIERLTAPLAPRFDEATAAVLARAFSKLPAPRVEGRGWLRLQNTTWAPPVLPQDTARVLARTARGPLTVADFLRSWERLPAVQRDRPDSAAAVIEWARSFLAQDAIDAEAERMGLGRLPEVEAQLEARRQVLAVEAYYRRAVLAGVDTSEARLEAEWRRDPERFRGPPHDRYLGLWYEERGEAEAALRALERGASWDSLVDARFAAPGDPQLAEVRRAEAALYREPQALMPENPDTLLRATFASAAPGSVHGPRERAGQWWVYRFLERRDGRHAGFAEARPAVLARLLAEEGETALDRHLAELRRRFGVRVNERALAGLTLTGPGAESDAAPSGSARRK